MATVSGYDAFISYSHQHDFVLGPALQTDLERFAKPWYRIRALRIFCDRANLSANPALWASIEDGLRASEWFILLASADAAESVWVDREVQWWLTHRSPDRLLIVGTGSGLAWDEQERDWVAGAPVPPALRGALTSEPLWADLSDIQIDGRKPLILADRVAAVAAPIRGMPKDMLVGEHLREHRRAMRLVGGAAAALATLTVLAVVASFIAIGQRNIALRQRDQAIYNQIIADALQFDATNTSLAAQLDLTAYHMQPTPDLTSRLLSTENTPLSTPLTGHTGAVYSVAFSPDGRTLASGSGDGTIQLWDVTDPARPQKLGRIGRPLAGGIAAVRAVAFSPDGRTLATGSDDGTIRLWDVTDPAHAHAGGQYSSTSFVYSVAFSPDGRTLASGGSDYTIRLWNINVSYAIQRICTIARNDLTPQQWHKYLPQLPYKPSCAH